MFLKGNAMFLHRDDMLKSRWDLYDLNGLLCFISVSGYTHVVGSI